MAAFVLDASVAVSWRFPGDPLEDTVYSRQVLKHLASGDALVRKSGHSRLPTRFLFPTQKRKRISQQQIREYLTLLKALPIRVEVQDIWANVDLESVARAQNLAAYDAAYLQLALRTRLPLATSDHPLRTAAIAQGITILR
jgi:predicted nucleic acid-binding protein